MHHHGNSALSYVSFQNLFHNLQAEDMSFCEASQYHSLLCKTFCSVWPCFPLCWAVQRTRRHLSMVLKVSKCIHWRENVKMLWPKMIHCCSNYWLSLFQNMFNSVSLKEFYAHCLVSLHGNQNACPLKLMTKLHETQNCTKHHSQALKWQMKCDV